MTHSLESLGVQELNAQEIREVEGGFTILRITGLFDGIRGNTRWHWF